MGNVRYADITSVADSCSEVDWVWINEKGVLKSGWEVIDESGDWTEVGGDKEGLWVMSDEWWVLMMMSCDDDEWWVVWEQVLQPGIEHRS